MRVIVLDIKIKDDVNEYLKMEFKVLVRISILINIP